MKLRLYSYFRSSSTWRVRIALAWKGLAYETVPVSLIKNEQWSESFGGKNPQHMVPFLEAEDRGQVTRIAQSMAMLEWIEETTPAPPLLPRDPAGRARARWLAEIVNSSIQPFQNLSVLRRVAEAGMDDKAWARGFIERGLAAFDAACADSAGAFCVGDAPSFADCALVPQLYHARRFAADLAPFGRLVAIETACAALPAFQAAHPDAQPDAPPA